MHTKLIQMGRDDLLEPLRLVELIFESCYIAQKSKNKETIDSRLKFAKENFEELKEQCPEMADSVEDNYLQEIDFIEKMYYENITKGYLEKINKVKMQKTKNKYASEILIYLEKELKYSNKQNEIQYLINKVKTLLEYQTSVAPALDRRKENQNKCIFCNQQLKKVPQKKTKCTHCGNFLYSRTRPDIEEKVVVTEKEANNISCMWNMNILNEMNKN